MRDALRARVDCPISGLGDRADNSFVTVGGIISEFKRHKTKRGDPMAFATLDDIEGQVEMLVLGKAYMESTEFLGPDAIVVITGRLDHQERGQTKIVASEVELFEPTEDEVARARKNRADGPLILSIDASAFGPTLIEDMKVVFESYPGESEVELEMLTREGKRRLRFGDGYRVKQSAGLKAELDALISTGAQAA